MTTVLPRHIHLIAPSGYCFDQQGAERGIQRLREAGHTVNNTQILTRRYQRFAGTDQQRAADLEDLPALDPCPDIILAVRGGYGMTRLLPLCNLPRLARYFCAKPTIFCGHSDFTALQLALLTQGMITFSGPMLAGNFGANTISDFTWRHFWHTITQQETTLQWPTNHLNYRTEGTLWGGNLTMITSLAGTPWMPVIDGGIMVIEDINEPAYKIERMLLQLAACGILSRQSAIVCGNFTGITEEHALNEIWHYLRTTLSCPIITGLSYGHEPDTVTLPFGAKGVLTVDSHKASLTFSDYPTLC
ncbi:MAG: Murein tetrapeptide carboxypeptidase [Candidatus Erwinia impunctatus]